MSSKRFLYLCLVLTILLSGMVTPLFQPAAVLASSPDTPSNVSPADGATDVSLAPTLQSSAFSDPNWYHRHAASQWQIAVSTSHSTNPDGSYAVPVYNSVTNTPDLTSTAVPSATLAYSTTYYWHVRYQDNKKSWSGWSPETSFTTQRASLTFADPNLEAAIREAIGKPTGPIYQSDLDTLVTLNATTRGIKDLTGLEHCTSLTRLDLSNNQISDISPLAGLSSLIILNLHTNQIGNTSPLAGLTNLTELVLRNNQIVDISPLAGLTNLTDLHLADNQISGISPLAGLSRLTILNLNTNQISNISPLASLTKLTELVLHTNQISDISPLAGLTNLTELFLGANQISDISPLAGLGNVSILNLHANKISDVNPLVSNLGIASGDTVYLNTNPLSSASIDAYIPALEARGVKVYWDVPDNLPPNQPSNVSPSGPGISLTPTLRSSAFSDPDAGDAHAASWWQIRTTSGDYSGSVFDSYVDTKNLTSIAMSSGTLDYSTTYYWHVRYQDNHGAWSGWSTETSFTTLSLAPSVTTCSAGIISTNSARLNGNLMSLGTASSVTVSFVWGTRSGSYSNNTNGQVMSRTGAFYFDLSNLSEGITYYYQAKAVSGGSAVYGKDVTFTTARLGDSSAPVISSVRSDNITVSGATITWTTNEPATSQVEYGLTKEYGFLTTEDANLVTSHSVDLADLEAGKTYHYRVISKDAANNQAVSADATFNRTARPSAGVPSWAWVPIAFAALGVVGAGAFFIIKGRLGQKIST